MRKYFFAVILGAVSTSVSAQTSGLGPDCDKCLQGVSCGSKLAFEKLNQYSCEDIMNPSSNLSEEVKSWKTLAANTCSQEYATLNGVHYGVTLASDYIFDKCSAMDQGISSSDLEDLLAEDRRGMTYSVLDLCYKLGWCKVPSADYYVHACGTLGEWGLNSSAGKCPDGGTTGLDFCFGGILCCYQDGGTFSDSTGSGTLTGKCGYGFDTVDEAKDYEYSCL